MTPTERDRVTALSADGWAICTWGRRPRLQLPVFRTRREAVENCERTLGGRWSELRRRHQLTAVLVLVRAAIPWWDAP